MILCHESSFKVFLWSSRYSKSQVLCWWWSLCSTVAKLLYSRHRMHWTRIFFLLRLIICELLRFMPRSTWTEQWTRVGWKQTQVRDCMMNCSIDTRSWVCDHETTSKIFYHEILASRSLVCRLTAVLKYLRKIGDFRKARSNGWAIETLLSRLVILVKRLWQMSPSLYKHSWSFIISNSLSAFLPSRVNLFFNINMPSKRSRTSIYMKWVVP